MEEIIKINKPLEKSSLPIKSLRETIKVKQNNKKADFFLLGTLGANLLRNMLTGKEVIRAGERVIRAGRVF